MSQPIRIPADVDREDTVLANLTARQLLILAVTSLVLYGTWVVTRVFVPLPVFAIVALPVGGAAALLALGRRDGLSLDKLAWAALRQRTSPRYQVAAPEGIHPPPAWLAQQVTTGQQHAPVSENIAPSALHLPAEGVSETGVVDLGSDGLAVLAVCSTVNFALRTATEQEALTTAFGRYLHSMTAPVQILVRTERLDLTAQINELHHNAPQLPHPALEEAARGHADYLAHLGTQTTLLRRQVLLVLREPLGTTYPVDTVGSASPLAALIGRRARSPRHGQPSATAARRAAEARLVRRLGEAVDLLGPIGIVVTPLDAGQTTAVLAGACNPQSLVPLSSHLAGAQEVITTTPTAEDDATYWDVAHPPALNDPSAIEDDSFGKRGQQP